MLRIIVLAWDENRDKLREALSQRTDLDSIEYIDLVKLTFEVVYNSSVAVAFPYEDRKIDLEHITVIDNGNYQGTLLFVLPFDTYQPSENEYLMTFVGYGSCCGCDTLQAIQGYYDGDTPSEKQLNEFMMLCKDILTNTIKPYNNGWRYSELFDQFKGEENNGKSES